ncbi:hypothetical protein E1180_11965 [Roseibium denhamense]|uniref:Flagellar protein FlgN n=1 Tax=Roseibium denhamense TaxID=76305 RepID=A0ABY1PEY4_9HYPH|nr:hypothetical protein [Roseibium denhamense]MTI06230.1 hypothetical protein [Roseibium denhamense]SMP32714.1 hypothetical protein SAMN06265374_3585 [Roseibium denhamense]
MDAGQELASQELAPQMPLGNPAVCAPLLVAVERAITSIQAETDALRANPTTDLKTYEYRKSQALLDLTRARASVPPSAYSEELKLTLKDFKDVLEDNVALLKLHMNAVSEVVAMMSRTMIDQESDGTYKAPFPEPAR